MQQYLDLVQQIQKCGTHKQDRTGTGTQSLFGTQMRFDLAQGFPLITTKHVQFRLIAGELLWMLRGLTNDRELRALSEVPDGKDTIWAEWSDADGELGPIYGHQWRTWPGAVQVNNGHDTWTNMVADKNHSGELDSWGYDTVGLRQVPVDQIADVLQQLRTNPDSRRMIVTAWNPADIPRMALPPCHALFQFYTRELTDMERESWFNANCTDSRDWGNAYLFQKQDHTDLMDRNGVPRRALDCQLYQRSADVFLGVPFNIASYALLTHIMAHSVGMMVGEFVWTGGDTHIYSNHVEQVVLQLTREPRTLPRLRIRCAPKQPWEYELADFEIIGYDPHPGIYAPVAV